MVCSLYSSSIIQKRLCVKWCKVIAMFFIDMSCTLESIPEDLTAAGERNGEYLQVAKKGGRSGEEKQTYND